MTRLFAETYEDTAAGRATRLLAGVAEVVERHLGSRMDDETRIQCLIDLHRIERDDLPEEMHSLFGQLRAYFGIE